MVYHNTVNFDPFPVKADAKGYQLFKTSTLSGDERVYNAGVACRNEKEPAANIDDHDTAAPLKQLKHMWEQGIMMGIGTKRDVNAERLLFFFEDTVCVYPAQSFDNFKYSSTEWTQGQTFYTDLTSGNEKYVIIRNEDDYFSDQPTSDEERLVSYYTPIGNVTAGVTPWGVIGIQIKQKHYGSIIPTSVLEEPYQISFIAAFEGNTSNLVWY